MFGLKWPWVARRERLARQAAEREAAAERQRVFDEARAHSQRFVTEQELLAARARLEREQQKQQNQMTDYRRGVIVQMSDQRRASAAPQTVPRPRSLPSVAPRPSARAPEPSDSPRVVWEEPMCHRWTDTLPPNNAVVIPAGAFQPEPDTELRPLGGTFDGGGASGNWDSPADSSPSDGGTSGSSDTSSGGD